MEGLADLPGLFFVTLRMFCKLNTRVLIVQNGAARCMVAGFVQDTEEFVHQSQALVCVSGAAIGKG
jgi:hypothetical protein